MEGGSPVGIRLNQGEWASMANVAVDLGDRSVRVFGKSGDGCSFRDQNGPFSFRVCIELVTENSQNFARK